MICFLFVILNDLYLHSSLILIPVPLHYALEAKKKALQNWKSQFIILKPEICFIANFFLVFKIYKPPPTPT